MSEQNENTQPEQVPTFQPQPARKAKPAQPRNTNFLADGFEFVSEVINSAERSFLDLLSALVPYAVPIIPAFLTFDHVHKMMGFEVWVAWTAAFVTEVLGITSVSTAIRFYRHNAIYAAQAAAPQPADPATKGKRIKANAAAVKKNKSAKNKAPFGLAIFTYVFYLVIVLSVNVLLLIESQSKTAAVIWAIGLFSLLSVPSGILISIRSQFGEMLEEKKEQQAARRAARYPQQLGRSFAKDFDGVELEESQQQAANFRKPRRKK
jgi:hypothetical protein